MRRSSAPPSAGLDGHRRVILMAGSLRTADFDYLLPRERIAQVPLPERDASRMLVVDRLRAEFHDSGFRELPSFLREGDLIVLNETKVIPARFVGVREETGGKVEVLLVEPEDVEVTGTGADRWLVWTRSGGRLRQGEYVGLAGGSLRARIVERRGEAGDLVEFSPPGALEGELEEHGRTPLPPYIHREGDEHAELDRERYQTVYASEPGAVAAPTAGLHFTEAALFAAEEAGARVEKLVLHVGPGTFRPVKVECIEDHRMHPERYSVPERTAAAVGEAKSAGRRVVAVGTTVTRALEASAAADGSVAAGASSTDIFIHPGYEFRVVDDMVTNFHLPRSTLLMLVAAFAGRDLILEAYRHAVEAGYRFFSYGDAMLIL